MTDIFRLGQGLQAPYSSAWAPMAKRTTLAVVASRTRGDGLAVGVVAASRLPAVLDQIGLIDLDQRIRILARTVGNGAQPGRHPPRHGPALPLPADLVRAN